MKKYKYQLRDHLSSFEKQTKKLSKKLDNNVLVGWPPITYSPEENRQIMDQIEAETGTAPEILRPDKDEYLEYLERVDYKNKYPGYYSFNFWEKTFEHYLAFKLLDLQPGERFVDIAAEHSPHSEEFARLTGADGYMQDIMFKPGLQGKKIGGEASELPIEDGFLQGAFASCSIEHFEKDSDKNFVKEMTRVLSPGGRLIILPLYIHLKPFCATDPRYSIPGEVEFDPAIDVHCVKEYQNRHGRFYSPQTLAERLIKPNIQNMNFTVYHIENFKEIEPSIYCRFALVGKRV